ncbi:MAG: glycosyltransferase family 2 protein [Lactobacillus sp.]|nr:MAG: glycosyltransferase family 2 protein [Lactobacillus sp.]
MRLTIIIPFANETQAQITQLLTSIDTQVGVSFDQLQVIIVNDSGNSWPYQYPNLTQYQPKILKTSGGMGAGVARQYGMDHSQSDFVMFMDADDCLSDSLALERFWSVAQYHDLIVGPFIHEHLDENGRIVYSLSKKVDHGAAYGKWYKRSYLKKIGLRWSPELKVYEDAYFVDLALQLTKDCVVLNEPSYIWRLNMQSVGRRNGFAFARQLDIWVQSNRLRLAFLRNHNSASYVHDFYSVVARAYFKEFQYGIADVTAYHREQQRLLQDNRTLWDDGTPELLRQIATLYHQKYFKNISLDKFNQYLDGQAQLLDRKDESA